MQHCVRNATKFREVHRAKRLALREDTSRSLRFGICAFRAHRRSALPNAVGRAPDPETPRSLPRRAPPPSVTSGACARREHSDAWVRASSYRGNCLSGTGRTPSLRTEACQSLPSQNAPLCSQRDQVSRSSPSETTHVAGAGAELGDQTRGRPHLGDRELVRRRRRSQSVAEAT